MSANRVEIDLAALAANYRLLSSRLGPGTRLLAMVKAEAYGHGMVPCARALAACGADAFGVAEAEEGVRLRHAGIQGDIVVTLGVLPDDDADLFVRHRLQPVVADPRGAAALAGSGLAVHLKVDVGMGRLGVTGERAGALVAAARQAGLTIAGFMAHFPCADEDREGTEDQLRSFLALARELRPQLGERCRLHIANSAGMARLPASHLDLVRPGISLYGCPATPAGDPALRPVMTAKTTVIQVKEVPAGWGVSYGHRFVTRRASRLAVLPVGYDDGYLRRLSNRGQVLIRGRRLPVVGTVCMNACLVDVSEAREVTVGDEVVLLGCQGEERITADDLARWSETISYEILCLLGGRNRRVYLHG